MKNKLKYLIVTVLLAVFSSTLVICASAESNIPEAQSVATDDKTSVTDAAEDNFFTVAYEEISSYASEILCALTLAASLILAFAYKKGLLPLVQGALVSIGNAVTKIKDSTEVSEQKASRLEENLENGIQGAKDTLDKVIERIASFEQTISAKLINEEQIKEEYRKLGFVVGAQIDMLYDIFMTSALPQYQKDAVGERIAKMREAMAKDDEDK